LRWGLDWDGRWLKRWGQGVTDSRPGNKSSPQGQHRTVAHEGQWELELQLCSAVGLSFSLLYFRVWAQSESVLPITAMPPPTTKTATGERENFGLAVLV